jgi:transposase InsO family protein
VRRGIQVADGQSASADFTLVAHSDQGSQYVSEDYTQQLDDARVLASVGTEEH